MKHQSHKAKMDESLGMRRGKESMKKESMMDRRHESEGMSHAHHMKMHDHHMSEAKKHMKHMHMMAKKAMKHHKMK